MKATVEGVHFCSKQQYVLELHHIGRQYFLSGTASSNCKAHAPLHTSQSVYHSIPFLRLYSLQKTRTCYFHRQTVEGIRPVCDVIQHWICIFVHTALGTSLPLLQWWELIHKHESCWESLREVMRYTNEKNLGSISMQVSMRDGRFLVMTKCVYHGLRERR